MGVTKPQSHQMIFQIVSRFDKGIFVPEESKFAAPFGKKPQPSKSAVQSQQQMINKLVNIG